MNKTTNMTNTRAHLHRLARCALTAALLVPALTGCRMAERRAQAPVAPTPAEPRAEVTIFGPAGERVAWGVMLETARQADAIVIGETHGQPLGLAAAATLWEDLLDTSDSPALLMEFIESDHQVAVDDYLAGVTDDAAFREASNRTPGNYPPGHARMVDAAKAAGRPVVAANAPRRYVRMTTPQGYEALNNLTNEQRRLFTVPDRLVEGKYRDDFYGLMGGMSHGETGEGGGMPADMVDKFYYSQQLWDSTMAQAVVDAARQGHRPAVLVIGRFHSDFDGGTIEYINRRSPGLRICTISVVDTAAAQLAEEDQGRADFVLYVGTPEPAE